MKISEIITDKYKLRIPPTVYYDLLADVVESEEKPRYYPPCEDCHKKMNEIRKAYDKIQSAEPKTGHWKFVQRGKYIDICCSNCGYQRVKEYAYNYTVDQISEQDIKGFFSNSNMNFCENCGEKMIEPQESED